MPTKCRKTRFQTGRQGYTKILFTHSLIHFDKQKNQYIAIPALLFVPVSFPQTSSNVVLYIFMGGNFFIISHTITFTSIWESCNFFFRRTSNITYRNFRKFWSHGSPLSGYICGHWISIESSTVHIELKYNFIYYKNHVSKSKQFVYSAHERSLNTLNSHFIDYS